MAYFTRHLDPNKAHPYLLVSREDLADTAGRLFRGKERLLVAAHEIISGNALPDLSILPRDRFGQACRTLNAAYLAALHAAGGREDEAHQFAEKAKAPLLAFAELGVPIGKDRIGFLTENYLVSLAFAYDLVWDSIEWSDAERRNLRAFFYASIEELISYLDARHLSNLAAWAQCRIATTAFLFKDERLAEYCLEGPDGYPGRIAHEFFDDGLNYEHSTWAYQLYSALPVTAVALAARGAGAEPDPVKLRVENDLSLTYLGGPTGDYTMPFYPTDTAEFPRPTHKTLLDILISQFNMLRPDTTCPSIGDYGRETPRVANHWHAELAWDLFGDERAARLLSMGKRRAEGAGIFGAGLVTLAFGRALPKATRFDSVSTIYPHAGYAVMKSIEGDDYWGSDAICANLFFGPFGNGHGHADKLALEISGAGRKCCIEELDREVVHWKYYNSTVSHNSVVVGRKSQPGDAEEWDISAETYGRLLFRRFEPEFKVTCAEAPDVYEGLTTYRRTVAVADAYVVDFFEVTSGEPTVFDWFLHGRGRLTVKGAKLAAGSFGSRGHGYGFFTGVRKRAAHGQIVAKFSEGHRVFVAADGAAEVFAARGPWKVRATRPVFVVRRRGRSAWFLAVHDPGGVAVKTVSLALARGEIRLEVSLSERTDVASLRKAGRGPYVLSYDKGGESS